MRNSLVSGNALLHVRLVLTFLVAMSAGIAVGPDGHADEPPTSGRASTAKTEHFDHDPGWEGRNNRVLPKEYLTVVQAFGYSQTHFAGAAAGEMGGQVWRTSEPAYYGDRIGPRTLADRLSASGTFALTRTSPGSGLFFGFFRAQQPGAGGRPIGSLGMHLDCERSGARLAVRLITGQNQSCGTFITPFIPGKFRPTPLKNDGTRYTWKLDYDPAANDGHGSITATLGDESLTLRLRQGQRREAEAARFDRFGLFSIGPGGRIVKLYVDDLEYTAAPRP